MLLNEYHTSKRYSEAIMEIGIKNDRRRNGFMVFLMFIVLYAVIHFSLYGNTALGSLVFSLLYALLCFLFLYLNRISLSPKALPLLVLSLVFLSQLYLCSNLYLRKIALLAFFFTFVFYLYTGIKGNLYSQKADPVPEEMLRCFACDLMIKTPAVQKEDFFSRIGKSIVFSVFWKVALGLILGAPIFLFAFLMLSYDESFVTLIDGIFSITLPEISETAIALFYTVVLFAYLWIVIRSLTKNQEEILSDYGMLETFVRKLNFVPSVTVLAAAVPLLGVYILFFASQWKYYTSAFYGVLPEGYSYAEYARDGFFQLCAVSAVNFAFLLGCAWFVKRKTRADDVIIKGITLALSICSLILVATALSKMYLYVREYGLTPLRVYSTWGMIVLALLFIFFAIKALLRRMPFYSLCILTVLILLAVLVGINPDERIASYNVSGYLNDTIDTIDLYFLEELGDASVPSLVRLGDNKTDLPEKEKYDGIMEELREDYSKGARSDIPWYELTSNYMKSRDSLGI